MKIKSLKEQALIRDKILLERLENIVPKVMEEYNVDAWLIASKEYNEDLLFPLLSPASYIIARRVTMFLFIKNQDKLERYTLSMPDADLEKYYKQGWDFFNESQFTALNRILNKYDPKRIAINTSSETAFSDGLSVGLLKLLEKEVDTKFKERFIEEKMLSIRVMEIRTKSEKELYTHLLAVAFSIIDKMFSNEIIKPGITTCEDLEWFMKQSTNDLGLEYWFDPTMDLQRGDGNPRYYGVIEKGDLLHCDFGIKYLNLCTDTQRNCYVAKDNETEIPRKLLEGFKVNNRFQDIVREQFKEGISGNEVLEKSLDEAKKEGIQATLYSHPTNIYGHGPGPIIGLYSDQNPIPIIGEITLVYDTVFALELNVVVDDYTYYSEETVLFDQAGVHFLHKGRDEIYFMKEGL